MKVEKNLDYSELKQHQNLQYRDSIWFPWCAAFKTLVFPWSASSSALLYKCFLQVRNPQWRPVNPICKSSCSATAKRVKPKKLEPVPQLVPDAEFLILQWGRANKCYWFGKIFTRHLWNWVIKSYIKEFETSLFCFFSMISRLSFHWLCRRTSAHKNTCSQWTFGSTAEKAILLSPQVVDRAKDSEQGVLLQKSPPQKGDAWKIPMGFEALRTHLLLICIFSQAEIGKSNSYVIFELHHSTTWVVNSVDFSLF